MRNVRCRCGKIVCQVENLPEVLQFDGEPSSLSTPAVVILCRHCKRHVVLQVPGSPTIECTSDESRARGAHFFPHGM